MTYDAASGTVIYRSKVRLGPKRNFQVMAGAQGLELRLVLEPPPTSSRAAGARSPRYIVR
jgi:hypothetical protein